MMLVLNRGTAGCQLLAAGWNGTARYETSPFPVLDTMLGGPRASASNKIL